MQGQGMGDETGRVFLLMQNREGGKGELRPSAGKHGNICNNHQTCLKTFKWKWLQHVGRMERFLVRYDTSSVIRRTRGQL